MHEQRVSPGNNTEVDVEKHPRSHVFHSRGITVSTSMVHQGRPSVGAIYDRVAGQYNFFAALWDCMVGGEATRHFRAFVHKHVSPGAFVLDAGTGTGRSISLVLEEAQPRRVIGVDLSARMLAKAHKKLHDPRVEFIQADATRLPFPENTFDIVTSMWMLETLPDPLAAVRELLRVVQPDGIVITVFSTLPSQPLLIIGAVVIEAVMKPLFGGRFLRKQEQPLHDCTMSCIHRYEHGCATRSSPSASAAS